MGSEKQKLISVKKASELTSYSARSLDRMAESGQLTKVKLNPGLAAQGRRCRVAFVESEILAIVNP